MAPVARKQKSVAYLLWCLGFFGLCGVHRLYTERYVLGILYLFTFGFCFLGQLIDLLLIPDDVGSFNVSQRQAAVSRLTPSRATAAVVTGSNRQDASGSLPASLATPERQVPESALSPRTRALLADAQASIRRLEDRA